jgi:hypothetical protein
MEELSRSESWKGLHGIRSLEVGAWRKQGELELAYLWGEM